MDPREEQTAFSLRFLGYDEATIIVLISYTLQILPAYPGVTRDSALNAVQYLATVYTEEEAVVIPSILRKCAKVAAVNMRTFEDMVQVTLRTKATGKVAKSDWKIIPRDVRKIMKQNRRPFVASGIRRRRAPYEYFDYLLALTIAADRILL